MKYYIDYENVNSVGLDGIELLNEDDEIHVYYGGSNMTMKMSYVSRLLETKASIVMEHVQTGTANALDFQMIVNIFCDINQSDSFVIVSRDKGYDAAINAGKKKGYVNGFRADSVRNYLNRKDNILVIESRKEETENVAVESDTSVAENGESLLWIGSIVNSKCDVSLADDEISVVNEALEKARGKNAKNLFYQCFVSKYGAKDGRDFYSKIKPAYEELRKSYRSLHATECRS